MKKTLLVLVLVLALSVPSGLVLAAPQAQADTPTIGFAVSTLANPFFVTMKDAGEAKAAELGMEMITLDAQDNNERQASQIEDLISRGVDVLIVNPVDSDAVATSIEAANEAGMPVITVTRPSNGGEVVQHLDIDNAYAGQLVAEQLVKDLGGEGRVAILEGIPGAPSAQQRQEGFLAVLEEYPDIEVVSSLTANYSREEGARVMDDVLQANPALDAVYGHNDEMALGAVRSIKAADRMSEIKVYGIDAVDDALQAIKDGEMMATVKQQPDVEMETAVESAAQIIAGEEVEPLVIIPLVLVTAETLAAEEAPVQVSGTIGFAVSTLANPFFVTMKDAGEAKAAELGMEMITLDAQDNNERQASQIEDLISRGVDVLIVNPVDSDAVATSIEAANEAGIPVITVTRPSNGGEVVQHLDIDNAYAGQLVAEQLVKDLGGEGRVAILEGIPGAPSAQQRQEGFLAVLEEYPDIEVVSSLTANYSREEGARVMDDVLQANPALDAVYGHNDEMALGAVRSIKAADRMSEIKVYGIDAVDDALQAIKDGEMMATVKQQPDVEMETAVESAAQIIQSEEVEPLVIIPLVLVTAETLSE
ncbi:substrate-binding domain-containing protein [Aggregatilinea lenta]|uniref:substrate-binding domain-containing protein n=1 Tax=Aggregatilinea lenta TaxID=913108 RepID=UPI001EE8E2C6|nr:substrate-binding domain-containing protein [Aggregatilinea lenta]